MSGDRGVRAGDASHEMHADVAVTGPSARHSAADAQMSSAGQKPSTTTRRGVADPVKALMHRHRELCERAVDPLEIAAGLEAHGVTDRTAARFRHRDVFSLAEEMYARAPRAGDTSPRPAPGMDTTDQGPSRHLASAEPLRPSADWILLTLLPGALCAATVAALRLTDGRTRPVLVAVGMLAMTLALRAALRRGPLSPRDRTRPVPHGTAFRTCWLLAYAALGDGLLGVAVDGGPDGLPTGVPDGPWLLSAAPLLTLALACAPAAWCAHAFAVHARRRLTASLGLEEFATSVRPLLLATFALFLAALSALTALCAVALGEPAAHAQTLTLGALLLLARLLAVHGFTHAPHVVLSAAAAVEVAALATVFAGRLPGCALLSVPVDTLVDTWGPAAVPALACGAAALTLLIQATRTLTRASAHARTDEPR